MTIKTAFEKFIFAKRIQGLAEKSIKDYQMIIGLFVRYIGEETDIKDITREYVNSYMEYQLNRKLATSTYSTYVRNAKIFLMWLENEFNVDLSASEIKTPKMPKISPYIYSTEDIKLILSVIRFEDEWMIHRNKSMISLMLDSGLRQEEVCNLKKSDIDFHGNIIKVHGKGNKERLVPLGNFTKRCILTYLEQCPFTSKKLFLNFHGEPVTTNTLKQMAAKMSKQLPFEFSCHKLRHNFATNFCLDQVKRYGKMDVYSLMTLMGHANIHTTERYMHFANQILISQQHISHMDDIFN